LISIFLQKCRFLILLEVMQKSKKPDDTANITEPKTNYLGVEFIMKLRKVTVQFRFENEIRESENEKGFLIGTKVLLLPSEKCAEPGLYHAVILDNDDKTVLVDLDADSTDFLCERPGKLLNLIFA